MSSAAEEGAIENETVELDMPEGCIHGDEFAVANDCDVMDGLEYTC